MNIIANMFNNIERLSKMELVSGSMNLRQGVVTLVAVVVIDQIGSYVLSKVKNLPQSNRAKLVRRGFSILSAGALGTVISVGLLKATLPSVAVVVIIAMAVLFALSVKNALSSKNQEVRIPPPPLTKTELSEKLRRGEEVTCSQIVDALELGPVIGIKNFRHSSLTKNWSRNQLLGYIIRNNYPALKYLMEPNDDEHSIGKKAAEAIEVLAPFVKILYLTEGYDDTLMDRPKKKGVIAFDEIKGLEKRDLRGNSMGRTTERVRARPKQQLTLRRDSILDNMPEGFLVKLLEKMDSINGVVVGCGVRVKSINEEIIKPLVGHPRLKTSLKTLDMRGLPKLTDDQIEIMSKSFENLTKWDLSNTDISLKAISHIKNNMTKLSVLSLRNCQHLTSEVYEILVEMESLTRIELSSGNVGEDIPKELQSKFEVKVVTPTELSSGNVRDEKDIPEKPQSKVKVVIVKEGGNTAEVTGRGALLNPGRMMPFKRRFRAPVLLPEPDKAEQTGDDDKRGSVELHKLPGARETEELHEPTTAGIRGSVNLHELPGARGSVELHELPGARGSVELHDLPGAPGSTEIHPSEAGKKTSEAGQRQLDKNLALMEF